MAGGGGVRECSDRRGGGGGRYRRSHYSIHACDIARRVRSSLSPESKIVLIFCFRVPSASTGIKNTHRFADQYINLRENHAVEEYPLSLW